VDVRLGLERVAEMDLAAAIFTLAEEAPGKVELELVYSATDRTGTLGE